MKLIYCGQFEDDWLSAEVEGPATPILISALLRLDYEVLAWDGENWADVGEVLFDA